MTSSSDSIISCVEELSFPFKTADPFLFCVYHKDNYPAGNPKMEAPRRGNGADFDPAAPYRMYHGDKIPGFPQHPHRGFETITATMEGLIDHSDSLGNGGRYGMGDLQWMTAGGGVVHAEMFPLVKQDAPNPTRFFQIWLNLPRRSKMVDPDFAMHWAEDIPHVVGEDSLSKVTVWAGTFGGKTALPPPVNSWGADAASHLGILLINLEPGGSVTLSPELENGQPVAGLTRTAYFMEGSALYIGEPDSTDPVEIYQHCAVTLKADKYAVLSIPSTLPLGSEVLILQGRAIGEPVAQHGPFVMNSTQEIQQAFADYRRTQFGGWPWPDDGPVFPVDKGRFSLLGGKETEPPQLSAQERDM